MKATKTVSVCLFLCLACLPQIGQAQVKYSPDHPEVKAMADAAVGFLKSGRPGMSREYRALAALAIVEHGKRYSGRVPKSDSLVKAACDDIVSDIDGMIGGENEMYFPSLAMILLAETDALKYKEEIKKLLAFIKSRQEANGSFTYRSETNTADTSQTQFAALAMFVGKHHGFNVDVQMAKRTLEWVLSVQQGGNWYYKYQSNGAENNPGTRLIKTSPDSLSMQAAGIGTAYLLADFLQLNKRAKSMSKSLSKKDDGLPKTVSIYVPPVDGEVSIKKDGPLVKFDRAKFSNGTRAGNQVLQNKFQVDPAQWPTYYLYAMERYAYFREQAEGDMGNGSLATWYDQSVEYLKTQVEGHGGFKRNAREPSEISSAFGVLVLVRSSEVITSPVKTSRALGALGFQEDAVLLAGTNGQIKSVNAEKNLGELIEMMQEGATAEQLKQLSDSLKKQIVEFRNKDDKSRGEIKAFLQSMIGARDYFRRLIAVRFLAGEQDMDNVPALIFALGDPDLRICVEAHDGLRLVSRKIDSMSISEKTRTNALRDPDVLKTQEKSDCRIEFDDMKKKWTEWFLKIRPGAELLD